MGEIPNPPDWALEKAMALSNWNPGLTEIKNHPGPYFWAHAFARYIAEHEQPPVDPLQAEAAKFAESWAPCMVTPYPPERLRQLEAMALAALRRGIQLVSEVSGEP